MSKIVWGVGGVAVGLVLGMTVFRQSEGRCCSALAAAARSKVGEEFGSTAQKVGDALGLWDLAPELVALTGGG